MCDLVYDTISFLFEAVMRVKAMHVINRN